MSAPAPRTCAWCDTDISAPGMARPVMYARAGGPGENWQCADEFGCGLRQAELDRQAGTHLFISALRPDPVAALAATGKGEK